MSTKDSTDKWRRGAAKHRCSILASHLAALGLILVSMLLRLIDGTGYMKVDRGLIMLIEPSNQVQAKW